MIESSAAIPLPVDMYLPNGSDVYVPWGSTLTIHFTESCKPFFDHPDSFETIDGDPLPDEENCCAGSAWGPGLPQDGYQDTDVRVTCAEPDPGACHGEVFSPVKGGVHVIHIGSSLMSDLRPSPLSPQHMHLPKEPFVHIDPLTDTLMLDFDSECAFRCLLGDVNKFDAGGQGLPNGQCFRSGGSYGPAKPTVTDALIVFDTARGCVDLSEFENATLSGHVIHVGSGPGFPALQTLANLFLTDPDTLRSWPETRKVIEAVFHAPKLDSPQVVTDFLVNLKKAGDELYRVLPGK